MDRVQADVSDPIAQIEAAERLLVLCKDEASTGIIVQAGAVKTVVAAMQHHIEHAIAQRELIVVLHRLIERGGSSAAKASLSLGAVQSLCDAMEQHPKDRSIQGAVASCFRILMDKGGTHGAKAVANADVLQLLSGITSRKDANVQYQAFKAVEAIEKAIKLRQENKEKKAARLPKAAAAVVVYHSDDEDDSDDGDGIPSRQGSKQKFGMEEYSEINPADALEDGDHLHLSRGHSKGKCGAPSLGVWAHQWGISLETLKEASLLFEQFAQLPDIGDDEHILRDGLLFKDDMLSLVCRLTGVRSIHDLPREAQQTMRVADQDGDGKVDFFEFTTWYDNRVFQGCMHTDPSFNELRRVGKKMGLDLVDMEYYKGLFDKFDTDGGGTICFNEFKSMMKICMKLPASEKVPENRVQHWWSECDENGNGSVDLEEFIDFHMKHFDINSEDPLEDYYSQLRQVSKSK